MAPTLFWIAAFLIFSVHHPDNDGIVVQAFSSGVATRHKFVSSLDRRRKNWSPPLHSSSFSRHMTLQQEEIAELKIKAERMRLEAERLDLELTLKKIEAIEAKLENTNWLTRHPEQETELKAQLQLLRNRLCQSNDPTTKNLTVAATPTDAQSSPSNNTSHHNNDDRTHESLTRKESPESTNGKKASSLPSNNVKLSSSSITKAKIPKMPSQSVFSDQDLKVYVPLAQYIERSMANSTLKDKVEAFRASPEFLIYSQQKIRDLSASNLEELDSLKDEYLYSTSSKEKERLKREIDALEQWNDDDGPVLYIDDTFLRLPPLTDEELQLRVQAISALPECLIALYKEMTGVDYVADNLDDAADDTHNSTGQDQLQLAVQVDYYSAQLYVFNQIPYLEPITDRFRQELLQAYNSLPQTVQDHFAQNHGLEDGRDANKVLRNLESAASSSSSPTSDSPLVETNPALVEVIEASTTMGDLSEYNDIEFVDRSQFLEDLQPSIAKMEGYHPSLELINEFVTKVLDDKKSFMITQKPERVLGGYYIRGVNLFQDDEDVEETLSTNSQRAKTIGKTAADKLVEDIAQKLKSNPKLNDQLEYFFIMDPAPPSDEEIEMGDMNAPILVITTKDRNKFYGLASPLVKSLVTFMGMGTTLLFAIGSCALNPLVADRLTQALDNAKLSGAFDSEWFVNMVLPIIASLTLIQLSHELGHRAIASRDKVRKKNNTQRLSFLSCSY